MMYATDVRQTDRRQTDVRQHHRLMRPPIRGEGHNNGSRILQCKHHERAKTCYVVMGKHLKIINRHLTGS